MFCIDKKTISRWPERMMTPKSAKASRLLEIIATDSASVSATKEWGCTYRRRHHWKVMSLLYINIHTYKIIVHCQVGGGKMV